MNYENSLIYQVNQLEHEENINNYLHYMIILHQY